MIVDRKLRMIVEASFDGGSVLLPRTIFIGLCANIAVAYGVYIFLPAEANSSINYMLDVLGISEGRLAFYEEDRQRASYFILLVSSPIFTFLYLWISLKRYKKPHQTQLVEFTLQYRAVGVLVALISAAFFFYCAYITSGVSDDPLRSPIVRYASFPQFPIFAAVNNLVFGFCCIFTMVFTRGADA